MEIYIVLKEGYNVSRDLESIKFSVLVLDLEGYGYIFSF